MQRQRGGAGGAGHEQVADQQPDHPEAAELAGPVGVVPQPSAQGDRLTEQGGGPPVSA
jgi:hypothetical protein